MIKTHTFALAVLGGALLLGRPAAAEDLRQSFAAPSAATHPWVYWFWSNGNITKPGITADLEAMKRVGIGGVIIMEVDQGTPAGPVAFGSPQWRTLFQFVCSEANRLGLKVNMNNDAGWCGSAGPWITPALSMQKLVWTETTVQGPGRIEQALTQPETVEGYYQDVSVLALPTPDDDTYRIPDIRGKAAFDTREFPAPPAEASSVPQAQTIDPARITDITSKYQNGKIVWDVPPGKWTILRLGHTSTGVSNHPAPQSGLGLETDKLSQKATDAQFNGLMAKLVADNAPFVGKSLVSTHIDSWETGSQNWTPTFRADFQRLRGYDPLPYLPVMTGRVVSSLDISERFLWDVRQTVSELIVANYAVRMRDLAHQHGIRLSIEAYYSPTDDLTYGGAADEPMAEFWASPMYSSSNTVPLMASSGHTYGHNIIGAEAFTSGDSERWLLTPASVKTLGDWAFTHGINRFVIHRYAMQPFLNVKPGLSMGPYGLHYERTQTWWEQSKPWHEYLSRCQFLLRQGHYVADLCYLAPEGSPREFNMPPLPQGYSADSCSADVILSRMTVKDGRLTLPDGMSYRVLVLPDAQTMTPVLLAKIAALVQAGATVVGPPPVRSPSLVNYPASDAQVQKTAQALWGNADGKTILSHAYGKGQVIWGKTPLEVLSGLNLPPDFSNPNSDRFNFIHRRMTDGTDLYFVANGTRSAKLSTCVFRVAGRTPEFWWPETGRTEPVAEFVRGKGTVTVPMQLAASQSVFVVFRPQKAGAGNAVSLSRNGERIDVSEATPVVIQKAVYGVLSDPSRTRDVRTKLQALIDGSGTEIHVGTLATGDDPAFGTVKTLKVDYEINGTVYHAEGQDPDSIDLGTASDVEPDAKLIVTPDHHLMLRASKNGTYKIRLASGKTQTRQITALPALRELTGPWSLTFPPAQRIPAPLMLNSLRSWSLDDNFAVSHFSGTATYQTTFSLPAGAAKNRVYTLNLGDVQVFADVTLNGKPLGVLWKPPYRVDISQAAKPGVNTLQVKVTNLWINRMIGDQSLPEDSDRNKDGTLKAWPQWVLDGKTSPTGRQTFTTWRLWNKDSPLQPSGLLGPVTLSTAQEVTLDTP